MELLFHIYKYMYGTKARVKIDLKTEMRYDSRRNANNSTLLVYSLGYSILGRVHVQQANNYSELGESRSFIGSSNQMEGLGFNKYLEFVDEYNKSHQIEIDICAMCHDHDSYTAQVLRMKWPNALEYNDPGHATKTLRQELGS